jgi:molybdate transport system substrate-binding protein
MSLRPRAGLVAVVASGLGAVMLAACGGAEPASSGCDGEPTILVIHAASSLREAFGALAEDLVADVECGTRVVFEFGSSGALASRIVAGAPAAVFVSAGASAMGTVVDSGGTFGEPVDFVANHASLMVSVRSERADRIMTVEDLLDDGVLTGLCVRNAPCGSLADVVLAKSAELYDRVIGRSVVADTEATNSADLITKIALGELDAGIVLTSECVTAAADTICRGLPAKISASTVYSVVALDGSATVDRIIRTITSDATVDRLVTDHGFARLAG